VAADVPPHLRAPEHRIVLAGALAGLVAFLVLGNLLTPDARGHGTHEQLGLPSCKAIEWWGVPCPGCGVTTALTWAAHGRIVESFRAQPFGLLVALSIPAAALWAVIGHARGRDLWRDLNALTWRPWGWWMTAALAAAWIYKIVVVVPGGD